MSELIYENIKNGKYENKIVWPTMSICSDKQHYYELIKKYNQETARMHGLFMSDLLDEYDVKTNPKANDCYRIAWDHGHSNGYVEVLNWFDELVELIK